MVKLSREYQELLVFKDNNLRMIVGALTESECLVPYLWTKPKIINLTNVL